MKLARLALVLPFIFVTTASAGSLRNAGPKTRVIETGARLSLSLEGNTVRAVSRHRFSNMAPAGAVEAVYEFSLPRDAAVTGLVVKIDGKKSKGRIVSAASLSRIGPAPEGAEPDLAILKMVTRGERRSSYELHLYPVSANETIEVEVQWLAALSVQRGRQTLELPQRSGNNLEPVAVELSVRRVPKGRRLGRVLLSGNALVKRRGKYIGQVEATDAINLAIFSDAAKASVPSVEYALTPLSSGHGLLSVLLSGPAVKPTRASTAKDLILVIDVSRSMQSMLREIASFAVDLSNAHPGASLQVVTYGRRPRPLFAGFVANSTENRASILRNLERIRGGNGSHIGLAAELVTKLVRRDETLIVFVDDGITPSAISDRQLSDILEPVVKRGVRVSAVTVAPRGGYLAKPDELTTWSVATRSGGQALSLAIGNLPRASKKLASTLRRPQPMELMALGASDSGLPDVSQVDAGDTRYVTGWYSLASSFELPVRVRIGEITRELVAKASRSMKGWASAIALARGASVAASPSELMEAAAKRGVVTDVTALWVPYPGDAYAADRLRMVKRWGPDQFRPAIVPRPRLPFPPFHEREESVERIIANAARKTGTLPRNVVGRLMSNYVMPRARACFRKQLSHDRSLRGTVIVELEIARGEVHWAEVSGNLDGAQRSPRAVERCVREAAYSIRAPRVQLGATRDSIVRVRYPLNFRLRGKKGEVDGGSKRRFNPNDPLEGL